jgi:K+-sensing histidine kinase KdpD
MPPISAAEDVAVFWLATLQRALGRASHDVKDALNGVSVNLEVIRSRATRPDAPAATVAQFAEAATQQVDRLTTLIEAVLALGRPEREPVDVGVTLRRVATLCGASASSSDATVRVRDDGVHSALTRVRGDAVRLALAAPLLDVVAGTDREPHVSAVVCTLANHGDDIVVTISAEGRRPGMPDGVAEAVRAAGVRWCDGAQDAGRKGTKGKGRTDEDFSLAFPRA